MKTVNPQLLQSHISSNTRISDDCSATTVKHSNNNRTTPVRVYGVHNCNNDAILLCKSEKNDNEQPQK
jgi:hypothetical protein